jgi:serine/threonine protein kinase
MRRSSFRERLGKDLAAITTKNQETIDGFQRQVSGEKLRQVFQVLGDGQRITDLYELGKEIYNGGPKGRVVHAKRKQDNADVVVKIRSKLNRAGERNWKAIMTQLHGLGGKNDHVLDIMEILECPMAFYVVMPKMNGGELFEFLQTETEVPESECKRITREILCAVGHLHKTGLIHRDIKPENIMFNIQDEDPEGGGPSPKTVKLIDFDTCLEWTPCSPKTKRFVGTPGYIAPEALLGETTPQSDIWSVGVILYILMTGEMPWTSLVSIEDGIVGSPSARAMYDAIKKEDLGWDEAPWPDFPLARDLCQKLIAFDMQSRLQTIEEAMAHPWLQADQQ